MKRVLILCACALASFAFTAPAPDGDVTMNGSYLWTYNNGKPGDLRAVFTPNGEGKFNVSFYFKFDGQNHTYTGTAEGSLDNGALKGSVTNENKRRTFTFEGTCTNGKFEGNHAETTKGRAGRTGTMKLSK